MYLPYAKGEKSQHCSQGINVAGHNVNEANYVIKYTAEPTEAPALNATWANKVMPNKEGLLDHVL